MVQFIRCQVNKFLLILIFLLNTYTDFVLNDFLIFFYALAQDIIAILKLLSHVILLSVLIKHFLKFF